MCYHHCIALEPSEEFAVTSPNASVVVKVRAASDADIESILSIYNHYVLNSTVTFDTAEQSFEERLKWLKHHQQEGLPVIVAEENDQIIGWGSLSYYHARCAYRTTVEFSIYLAPQSCGKGVGRMLLAELIELSRSKGYHCIVGLICSENDISIRLSHSFGFNSVGELKEVGRKFDRWLDVTFVQKIL